MPAPDDAEQSRIFDALFDEVVDPYVDVVEKNEIFIQDRLNHPGRHFRVKFVVDSASKDWTNPEVNASAGQRADGDTGLGIWTIKMFGGLFRRPEITNDGFSLVVCHEIGHHFGGFPFYVDFAGVPVGLASEGTGDYFATQSCLRKLWKGKDNSPPYQGPHGRTIHLIDLPQSVQSDCNAQWRTGPDRLLCYRIAMAAFSVGTLWGSMAKNTGGCETPEYPIPCYPRFDRSDRTESPGTYLGHSTNPQCRLDTYYSGALCTTEFADLTGGKIIPGKFEHVPENSARAQDEVFAWSCGSWNARRTGARPRCWFDPADVRR